MNKHTPGPWKEHEGFIVGPDFETVADPRCIPPTSENMDTMDANAHLISAAPDLLAACEQLIRAQDGVEVGDAYSAIHAAIAKAKGKSCPTFT